MLGRILYICSGRSFYKSHLGRKIASVFQSMRDLAKEAVIVCGGDIYDDSNNAGGEYGSLKTYTQWYRKTPLMDPLVTSASEWQDMKHDTSMLKYLQDKCKEWKPDIIWERSCRLHCAGLTFARQIGVPYVLEWKDHLVDYRFSLFRGRALKMEDYKNHESDYIVIESEVLRQELGREGVDLGKIIVAHNAVNADQFSRESHLREQNRTNLSIDDETVLAGYLGSYAFYHDTAGMVLAADIIRKKYPDEKIKFLMMGAGKEYPDTRKLAEDLGLLDNFIIMKPGVPQNDVPGILAAMDIAVLPGSTDIICPIKIQEYMASELATLAPDYVCNREVIDNERTGILFVPKNEHNLADKIMNLAKNPAYREQLGKSARKEVIERFSWEKTWGAALVQILRRTGLES